MSDLTTFQHPRIARMHERISQRVEERGSAGHRDRLLAGLTGRVLEIGAGNGLNFTHYPPTVTEVVAVEPENHLRTLAERAAQDGPVPVTVVAGHAEALPPGDFDAAVVSLVLCSVPDQRRSLAHIHRALRPGGELRFYEHVRSTRRLLGLVEDLITPLWSRLGGGCHPNRDTTEAIRESGFIIDTLDRFTFRPLPIAPSSHILGRAHRP
ncbi:MAG: class I SAM-dependent methyltransferase [Actinomycetota bacterium]|nr:class I SAM-dependent methyltransferase [Actinomycetota bacterium]